MGGAVSTGTLPRGGSVAPRGNVAKNQRSSYSAAPNEKKGGALIKNFKALLRLPLKIKKQPAVSGEALSSHESIPQAQSGKSFVFALSFAQLLGAGAILALLLIWAFFLGILMGRGMKNSLPMLAESSQQSALPQSGATQSAAPAESAHDAKPSQNVILMPEDLRFLNDLEQKPSSADVLTSTPLPTDIPQLTAVQRKVSEASVQNATPPFAIQPDQQERQTALQEENSDRTPAPRPSQNPALPQFEYVFQVAASTDMQSVQALQARLQKAGLHASVEHAVKNNAPLYRVLVTLRGSQKDSQALRARLEQLNLQNSFLRSKKTLQ